MRCKVCGTKAGFLLTICEACLRATEEAERQERVAHLSSHGQSLKQEPQLDRQPQRRGSQTRTVIFLLLAGPASCGLTTVPDNPSFFALIVFAAAWLAVVLSLLEKYKAARVITVIILCLSLIPFFVTLSNVSQPQAFRPGASAQNVLFGTLFFLLIRDGATLVFCGLALWSLPKPAR